MNQKVQAAKRSRGTKATREARTEHRDKNSFTNQQSINHYLHDKQSNFNISYLNNNKTNSLYTQSSLVSSSSRDVDSSSVGIYSHNNTVGQLEGNLGENKLHYR